MRKVIMSVLVVAFAALSAQAQTKIFKEVGDEISSQMKTIRQDNALVGYMVFTQLEKVSEDSFNYKVTIMDENLNDIGAVTFRDITMVLQDVSFENDVICVAYLKGNLLGTQSNGKKDYTEASANRQNSVFLQFISLDGKIIKTSSYPVNIEIEEQENAFSSKRTTYGFLAYPPQLKNISQKGFACFFGQRNDGYLLVFNPKGDILWSKRVKKQARAFYMLTSGNNIYLLWKEEPSVIRKTWSHFGNEDFLITERGYWLLGYSAKDTTVELNDSLKDDRFNNLKVLSFEIDPATGKPCIAGLLTKPKKDDYLGVFTTNINGLTAEQISTVSTYWDSNPLAAAEDSRSFEKHINHTEISNAFRDFNGNTCFTAFTSFAGSEVFKQNSEGKLSVASNILSERTMPFRPGPMPGSKRNEKSFYRLFNTDTKTSYLIIDDLVNISIYNIDQKKVMHTIPHKDSGIVTYVYPAKEGYIMIAEYNKKEKYTKFSIEAL